MPHMIPEYLNVQFGRVTSEDGETYLVPAALYIGESEDSVEWIEGKWFAHLTAPGYIDQTEWTGPYDTLGEAKAALSEDQGVNPDTGEYLTMGDE